MDYPLRFVQLGLARASSCFLLPGLATVSICCLPGLAEVRLTEPSKDAGIYKFCPAFALVDTISWP